MKWNNERTGLATTLDANADGVLRLHQVEIKSGKEFDSARRIVAKYDYRPVFLSHLFLFCCQTDFPLPFQNDWENKFFYGGKGNFKAKPTSGDPTFLLMSLMNDEPQPRLILPMEGLSSMEEKKLGETRSELAIYLSFDREIVVFPYITKARDLAYITFPPSPLGNIILLGKEDIAPALEQTIWDCIEHRGHDNVPGFFYKAFPFDREYKEVFG